MKDVDLYKEQYKQILTDCDCFFKGAFGDGRGRQWLRQLPVHRKHNQPSGLGVINLTSLATVYISTYPQMFYSIQTVASISRTLKFFVENMGAMVLHLL